MPAGDNGHQAERNEPLWEVFEIGGQLARVGAAEERIRSAGIEVLGIGYASFEQPAIRSGQVQRFSEFPQGVHILGAQVTRDLSLAGWHWFPVRLSCLDRFHAPFLTSSSGQHGQ